MRAKSDRKIHITLGETLKLTSASAQLTRLGLDIAPAKNCQLPLGQSRGSSAFERTQRASAL